MNKNSLIRILLISILCFAATIAINTVNANAWKQSGFSLECTSINPVEIDSPADGPVLYTIEVQLVTPPAGVSPPAVGKVYLSISGLPPGSALTKEMGVPPFASLVTINTFGLAENSGYSFMIVATSEKRGVSEVMHLGLIIGEGTLTPKSDEPLPPAEPEPSTGELSVVFSTDKLSYNVTDTVLVTGAVSDSNGNAVPDASISINVDDPVGEYYSSETITNQNGFFNDTFTLEAGVLNGTYIVIVSAYSQGSSGIALSTFVVGESSTPAISILSLDITSGGAIFEPGSDISFSVEVSNQGADLEGGIIWIEVMDPELTPIYLTKMTATISHGELITVEFHVYLHEQAINGVYTAKAFVSDGLISQGGKMLDMEEQEFIVQSSIGPDSPPFISIVDPLDGQTININETYRVLVNATDDNEVKLVEISVNGVNATWMNVTANFDGSFYYYDWNTTGLTNGTYTIGARATDNATQTSSTQISVIIGEVITDNPPSVSIVDPLDGQTININETYRVLVNATDDNEVKLVEILINGTSVNGTWMNVTANFNGTFYYYDWNTTGLTAGFNNIAARVTDNADQTSSVQIEVEVAES